MKKISKFITIFLRFFIITAQFLVVAAFLSSCQKSSEESFKETEVGKTLLRCVASEGNLTIQEREKNIVEVTLEKNNVMKSNKVMLQYELNPELNQAKLIGAEIPGRKKITKMDLAIQISFMCGEGPGDFAWIR
jgi:hypothetical protein